MQTVSSFKLFSSYFDLKKDRWAGSRGYLLKFVEEDMEFYSVLASWPDLGDRDLDLRYSDLENQIITKDFLPVYSLGKKYGQRASWRLESNLPSHFLSSGQSSADLEQFMTYSFPRMKAKIQKDLGLELLDLLHEMDHYPPSFKLCLDFNLKFSKEEVYRVFAKIGQEERSRISWIEDAFAGSCEQWQEFEETFGIAIFSDWYAPELGRVKKRVIKALRDYTKVDFSELEEVLLTSYLSHPLEQVLSQKLANSLEMDDLYLGLSTHLEYPENDFSKLLKLKSACLTLEDNESFQTLLDHQEWRSLGVFKKQEMLGS